MYPRPAAKSYTIHHQIHWGIKSHQRHLHISCYILHELHYMFFSCLCQVFFLIHFCRFINEHNRIWQIKKQGIFVEKKKESSIEKVWLGGMSMALAVKNEMMAKIERAALQLFTYQGYNGTSIREIASLAKCNVANISYYFQNKKGLLEYLIKKYFEGYFSCIDQVLQDENRKTMTDLFFGLVEEILYFQFQNEKLARFVQREVTLDTLLAREVMSTYFMREKYIFSSILHEGKRTKEFQEMQDAETLLFVRSYLSAPFIYSNYMQEVLHWSVQDSFYEKKYVAYFHTWAHRNLLLEEGELQICTV